MHATRLELGQQELGEEEVRQVVGGEALLEPVRGVGGLGLIRLGAHARVEEEQLERPLVWTLEPRRAFACKAAHGSEGGEIARNAFGDRVCVAGGGEFLEGLDDFGAGFHVSARDQHCANQT